jgi:hypothetical protein
MIQCCMNHPSGLPLETIGVAFDVPSNFGIAGATSAISAAALHYRTHLTLLQRALRRH